MGNEPSKVKPDTPHSDKKTKFYTLPRGKKFSKPQYRYDNVSIESGKQDQPIDGLKSELEKLTVNKATDWPESKHLKHIQEKEIFQLSKQLISKDLEITKLKETIKEISSTLKHSNEMDAKIKLDNLNKKYLEAKFKCFVLKEEKFVQEDQIEAQRYEIEGIQKAYFTLKRSQIKRSTRENKMLSELMQENHKLKQMLRIESIVAGNKKKEYTRLRRSFNVLLDAFNVMLIKRGDELNITFLNDNRGKSVKHQIITKQPPFSTSVNKLKIKQKVIDLNDNTYKRNLKPIPMNQNQQFEIDCHNKPAISRVLKLNGVYLIFNIVKFGEGRFRIIIKCRNKVTKKVEQLESRLYQANQALEINQLVMKDYASLRAQINILKEKFVRNRKIIKKLTNEYVQNGKRYERRYKHTCNTSIRVSTETSKRKGNLHSTNENSDNRKARINETALNETDKENAVIVSNLDSDDDSGQTNKPKIPLKYEKISKFIVTDNEGPKYFEHGKNKTSSLSFDAESVTTKSLPDLRKYAKGEIVGKEMITTMQCICKHLKAILNHGSGSENYTDSYDATCKEKLQHLEIQVGTLINLFNEAKMFCEEFSN